MAIVGFIGLGVMGGPMAGHLVQGGYDVKVYNRTSANATNWKKKYNGTTVNSPYDLAENCDFGFLVVPTVSSKTVHSAAPSTCFKNTILGLKPV